MKDPYPLGHALTQLYLSQEQSRGQEEASAMEAMHRAEEADSSFEGDPDAISDHLHAGMSDGALETHQMVQRSYGLYE
ncbi:hypothetical protein L3476_17170 [Paenibacillus thiaminolyticus]|uniref:hypothetical protein n=1 Tax=Paenibacillus thiaminolyticus TaxID=49283 RepID=UPI0011651F8D|nr:hypothetical protein [Paenibacillus thiaminolyticus]MDG0872358.1 hypothetical protein [Paenibacillus thiaminolyticus]NGP61363.1 hypothetical protein [Paenibacillus thiaminolyticus]WCR25098.1 hypothetical protein L3476_17170 [Paenibacillus thiaminolyticus]